MKNKKSLEIFHLVLASTLILCAFVSFFVNSSKLGFDFKNVISEIICEYKTSSDITGSNQTNLILLLSDFMAVVVLIAVLPSFVDSIKIFNRYKNGFDETNVINQGNDEIEYGIIHGSSIIVFIKTGLNGSIYGYKNKYLTIAKNLHKEHGCTVIVASNPNGFQDDFDGEMQYLKAYADSRKFEEYQVYYLGNSIGANLGMMNAWKYPEITKAVCINSHLKVNPQIFISGIKQFVGKKMYLVFGSEDPSAKLLESYTELENDKIKIVGFSGADHDFCGRLKCFIDLPETLFFHDDEFDNFTDFRLGGNIFPAY